ncbi:MAG TPA: ABC transporter permease [Chloroflexota bacterium]|nr:ABC transporter permease [Chloroflexota bacterium]
MLFFVVIWASTTVIFFLPRLASGRDPIKERMGMMAATGGVMQGAIEAMVKAYQARFGLDQPLWRQYLNYLADAARLDFNYSLSMYPARVIDLIALALPWTIGLLTLSTVLAFSVGSVLGALLAWPRAPGSLQYLVTPLFVFSAVPYYLLGMILIDLLAFRLKLFPIGGGSEFGTMPNLTLGFIADLVYHSILPALSIVVSAIGFWALAMRGMMVTVLGEDYITQADAKGLTRSRIFFRYAMRNALLPQTTSLALSLGHVVSGALIVEVIFRYPGIGTLLYKAVTAFDFFTIYGVVFFIIVSVSLATLVVDLAYPLLDPRIRHQKS